MSFDAIEKYNTRLLIPKETGLFATDSTVALLSNGRQKDQSKEHVQKESPLTSCVLFAGRLPGPFLFVKYVFDCVRVVLFLACVAGVRNSKNLYL